MSDIIVEESYQQRKKFLHDANMYLLNKIYLFLMCVDSIIWKCSPEEEMLEILQECQFFPEEGYNVGDHKTQKIF